jgi:sterol desaturase/sphingolipid hydroxylase (fatty acid hydroxylase superfamily)
MDHSIKNSGQGTLFENTFLEPLTKAPPYISAATYILVALSFLYVGYERLVVHSIWTAAAIYIGAIAFWTLFEYFAHRYIFHVDEYFPDSELASTIAYTLHGIHHEYPRDKERIIMPPVPGVMILTLLSVISFTIMGDYALLFMPGFITGYLLYTRIHYLTHTPPIPDYLKKHYKHHSLHHYKYPEKAFGISTTFWDRVFRTMPPE